MFCQRRTLLARVGQYRQVGASSDVRHQQMKHAFRVLHPEMVRGSQIILVDDVITTGSTIEAAALALRTAGAQDVVVVAFAQA